MLPISYHQERGTWLVVSLSFEDAVLHKGKYYCSFCIGKFGSLQHLSDDQIKSWHWKLCTYVTSMLFRLNNWNKFMLLEDSVVEITLCGASAKTFMVLFMCNHWYWSVVNCCSPLVKSCSTFCHPWTASCQASLSFTISHSLLKFTSIESVTPSKHLIFCCPLLLLPSIFPRISVFPNVLALLIRWPKC